MKSKLPFYQHFHNLRENPNWILKLILSIILISLTSILSVFSEDISQTYKEVGMSDKEIEQMVSITKIGTYIGSPFIAIFIIIITFIIFLGITKIMKSNVSSKSIFSATLSHSLIIGMASLIIILIQLITNLSLTDYNIASLNIFNKGNEILGAINLKNILGSYVLGILLFSTSQLSKKASIIWAILYFLTHIVFSIISSQF